MFESIQGRLASREPGRAVVEAGGLGYLVHVSLSDHDGLPRTGENVFLWLHLDVREDAWRLFGFLRAEDREAFRRLLRVKNVGPSTAMTILSGIGVADLAAAVAAGDAKTLTRVKGIGKKTADLIVAELKDDAKKGLFGAAPGRGPEPLAGEASDALRALLALGLDPSEARRKLDAATGRLAPGATVAEVVRTALRS